MARKSLTSCSHSSPCAPGLPPMTNVRRFSNVFRFFNASMTDFNPLTVKPTAPRSRQTTEDDSAAANKRMTPSSPNLGLSNNDSEVDMAIGTLSASTARDVNPHDPKSRDSGVRVLNAPLAKTSKPESPKALPRKFTTLERGAHRKNASSALMSSPSHTPHSTSSISDNSLVTPVKCAPPKHAAAPPSPSFNPLTSSRRKDAHDAMPAPIACNPSFESVHRVKPNVRTGHDDASNSRTAFEPSTSKALSVKSKTSKTPPSTAPANAFVKPVPLNAVFRPNRISRSVAHCAIAFPIAIALASVTPLYSKSKSSNELECATPRSVASKALFPSPPSFASIVVPNASSPMHNDFNVSFTAKDAAQACALDIDTRCPLA
mmetsp:Transcript_5616/g.20416  ORF Transcript_5616/g.20416 Transcript_5616/m.20416 type:complete len:375 (-) Transcript_5616:197-1321(-)